jgi:hypothetical protein
MSIKNFVNEFVYAESENFNYSRKEKKEIRKRLSSKLYEFTIKREKRYNNYIRLLKRKNTILKEKYDLLVSENTINTHDTVTEDVYPPDTYFEENEVYTREEYVEGIKMVFWAFIRMISFIYISLLVVQMYDLYIKRTFVIPVKNDKTLKG